MVVAPKACEYVPGGHLMQSSGVIELNVLENVPAGQKLHVDDPAAVEYVPIGQSMQTSTLEALVTMEYWPARHKEQLVDPCTFEEYWPLGQATHVLIEVAPTAVECVPGGHGVHPNDCIPEWSEYVPDTKRDVKQNIVLKVMINLLGTGSNFAIQERRQMNPEGKSYKLKHQLNWKSSMESIESIQSIQQLEQYTR